MHALGGGPHGGLMRMLEAAVPVRFEDGFALWFDGSKGYRLSMTAYEILAAAVAALSHPGVQSETDPVVSLLLARRVQKSTIRSLSLDDQRQLVELGYGFVLNYAST